MSKVTANQRYSPDMNPSILAQEPTFQTLQCTVDIEGCFTENVTSEAELIEKAVYMPEKGLASQHREKQHKLRYGNSVFEDN